MAFLDLSSHILFCDVVLNAIDPGHAETLDIGFIFADAGATQQGQLQPIVCSGFIQVISKVDVLCHLIGVIPVILSPVADP
ncbi:hypothetical protein ACFQ2X_05570 [Microbulbifer celer]|uniref:Uncharacterized protein n=1 Tax=Microbulbifer celer TaxID=435905 RepID=A0ABW3U8A8_9GAMM